jgi:hypothetical protein
MNLTFRSQRHPSRRPLGTLRHGAARLLRRRLLSVSGKSIAAKPVAARPEEPPPEQACSFRAVSKGFGGVSKGASNGRVGKFIFPGSYLALRLTPMHGAANPAEARRLLHPRPSGEFQTPSLPMPVVDLETQGLHPPTLFCASGARMRPPLPSCASSYPSLVPVPVLVLVHVLARPNAAQAQGRQVREPSKPGVRRLSGSRSRRRLHQP